MELERAIDTIQVRDVKGTGSSVADLLISICDNVFPDLFPIVRWS